ncbi:MAG TPA: DUF3106 domain-containing protein [Herbaspirillum sp.]|jgi:hypothetical protein
MPSIRSKLACAGGLLGVLLIAGSFMVCQHCGAAAAPDAAQSPSAAPAAVPRAAQAAGARSPAPKKSPNGPNWQALTPAQQLALAPLAGEWDGMDGLRKEKWIVIGNKYARMNPAEQSRIQDRMRDWIKLTPAQRRSVRQSYARTKKWDADQKSAQWQQYLQLSDEQKEQLSKQKLSRPPVTAISRIKPKPPSLLPIAPDPARAAATTATTVPATAIATQPPSPALPAAPANPSPAPAAVPPAIPMAPAAPSTAGTAAASPPNNK